MANITQVEVNGTTYDICDATARDSLNKIKLVTDAQSIEIGSLSTDSSRAALTLNVKTPTELSDYQLNIGEEKIQLWKGDSAAWTQPWEIRPKLFRYVTTASVTKNGGTINIESNSMSTIYLCAFGTWNYSELAVVFANNGSPIKTTLAKVPQTSIFTVEAISGKPAGFKVKNNQPNYNMPITIFAFENAIS